MSVLSFHPPYPISHLCCIMSSYHSICCLATLSGGTCRASCYAGDLCPTTTNGANDCDSDQCTTTIGGGLDYCRGGATWSDACSSSRLCIIGQYCTGTSSTICSLTQGAMVRITTHNTI